MRPQLRTARSDRYGCTPEACARADSRQSAATRHWKYALPLPSSELVGGQSRLASASKQRPTPKDSSRSTPLAVWQNNLLFGETAALASPSSDEASRVKNGIHSTRVRASLIASCLLVRQQLMPTSYVVAKAESLNAQLRFEMNREGERFDDRCQATMECAFRVGTAERRRPGAFAGSRIVRRYGSAGCMPRQHFGKPDRSIEQ